jgi:hypothetical protein
MKQLLARVPAIMTAAFFLGSCVAEQPRGVAYNEAAFAGYGGSGSGQVMGRAVIRGNPVRVAANTIVALMPINAYTTEIVQRSYAGHEHLQEADPRLQKYVREVTSDGDGNFVFRNVPPGNYYASCDVTWWDVSYNTDSSGNQVEANLNYDQWIYAKVSVRTGQNATVESWDHGQGG